MRGVRSGTFKRTLLPSIDLTPRALFLRTTTVEMDKLALSNRQVGLGAFSRQKYEKKLTLFFLSFPTDIRRRAHRSHCCSHKKRMEHRGVRTENHASRAGRSAVDTR